MNTKELLGLKIKEIRKQRKLTQEKLSELVGVDNGYISKLEIGQNFPTIGTLEKIANVLEVELSVLFQFTDAKDIDFKSEIIRIYDSLNKDKITCLKPHLFVLEKADYTYNHSVIRHAGQPTHLPVICSIPSSL